MEDSNRLINFFASCSKGLEEPLAEELKRITIKHVTVENGGVSFRCSDNLGLQAMLKSRIASRIHKEIIHFEFENIDELVIKAKEEVDWTNLFHVSQSFKINTIFDQAALHHFKNSIYLSQKLKDAVADHFRDKVNKRPFVDTRKADVQFLQHINQAPKNKWYVSILIDLSGEILSNRGYRVDTLHDAPIRENLAAGIINLTDWKPGKELFIDSMCGSATFLIEAALMAYKITPSYLKINEILNKKKQIYAVQKQKWFQHSDLEKYFYDLCSDLHEQNDKNLSQKYEQLIYGSDINKQFVDNAFINIGNAYLKGKINLSRQDARLIVPPKDLPGIIICNPPYGERLGNPFAIEKLYNDYGENLKMNFAGFRAYIFTIHNDLRKQISLRTSERIPLRNGNIECRLLKYELY